MSNALRGGVEILSPPRIGECNTFMVAEKSHAFKCSLSHFRIIFSFLVLITASLASGDDLKLSENDTSFVLSGRILQSSDISGITKIRNTGVLVSDEDSDVQILTFEKAGAKIVSTTALLKRGQEADLEAAASNTDGWFFVTGSHGVSKKDGQREPSRENVFRFKIGVDGNLTGLSHASLTSLILNLPALKPSVGRALQGDGLNIEGLAAIGDTLYFGIRTPQFRDGAGIMSISASSLFSPTPQPLMLHTLLVGRDLGVRGLEAFANGKILVLLGGKRRTSFLARWDPQKPDDVLKIVPLPSAEKEGKAEALLLLEETANSATIAVLYDSIPGGGARTFTLNF